MRQHRLREGPAGWHSATGPAPGVRSRCTCVSTAGQEQRQSVKTDSRPHRHNGQPLGRGGGNRWWGAGPGPDPAPPRTLFRTCVEGTALDHRDPGTETPSLPAAKAPRALLTHLGQHSCTPSQTGPAVASLAAGLPTPRPGLLARRGAPPGRSVASWELSSLSGIRDSGPGRPWTETLACDSS